MTVLEVVAVFIVFFPLPTALGEQTPFLSSLRRYTTIPTVCRRRSSMFFPQHVALTKAIFERAAPSMYLALKLPTVWARVSAALSLELVRPPTAVLADLSPPPPVKFAPAPSYTVVKSTLWSVARYQLERVWKTYPSSMTKFVAITLVTSIPQSALFAFMLEPLGRSIREGNMSNTMLCIGALALLWTVGSLSKDARPIIYNKFNLDAWRIFEYDFGARIATLHPQTLVDKGCSRKTTKVREKFPVVSAFTCRTIEGLCMLASFGVTIAGLAKELPLASGALFLCSYLYFCNYQRLSQQRDATEEELGTARRVYQALKSTVIGTEGARVLAKLGKSEFAQQLLKERDEHFCFLESWSSWGHFRANLLPTSLEFLTKVTTAVVAAYSAYAGAITPEQLIAALLIVGGLSSQLNELLGIVGRQAVDFPVVRDSLTIDRIGPKRLEIGKVYNRLPLDRTPKIELRQVCFSVPDEGGGKEILNDISLTFEPGKFYGIVGASGAGKTTLLRLLSRLTRPTSGVIFVGGYPLDDVHPDDLDKLFASFDQNSPSFNGYTVGQYLSLGDKGKPLGSEEIQRVFAAAAVDFVSTNPHGLETHLGPNFGRKSRDYSGGERQRLGIAQAIGRDTVCVFLDEPTSALDATNEQIVNESLFHLAQAGATVIVVSHTFANVHKADQIVHFEGGRVIEKGTHQELMKRNGPYAARYRTASKKYSATETNL